MCLVRLKQQYNIFFIIRCQPVLQLYIVPYPGRLPFVFITNTQVYKYAVLLYVLVKRRYVTLSIMIYGIYEKIKYV